jgi:hypothetical protein
MRGILVSYQYKIYRTVRENCSVKYDIVIIVIIVFVMPNE